MYHIFTMTPRFTIRVWGDTPWMREIAHRFPSARPRREPLCDIEVDTTTDAGSLTIAYHRGLQFIPQKMLTA